MPRDELRMHGEFLQPAIAPFTWTYSEAGAKRTFWETLDTEAERRALYNGADTAYGVWRLTEDGRVQALGSTAQVDRGRYRLRYRFQIYRETHCNPIAPASGTIRTGVALQVLADIDTTARNLDVSSLSPIAAAVRDNRVSGTISVSVIGIGATDGFLSSYLTNGTELTIQSVARAMEALAVMQALLNDETVNTVPSYLQIFRPYRATNTSAEFLSDFNACIPGVGVIEPSSIRVADAPR
jgi:hypothetical protein